MQLVTGSDVGDQHTTRERGPTLKRRVRATLSWLHLWVGLSVGVAFSAIGLSGTVLVFHNDLLCWRYPALTGYAPTADGEILAQLMGRWTPQGLTSLELPRESLPVWQGFFSDGHRAYFSPEDGSLLLTRSVHYDALLWLHELHTAFLSGPLGKSLVGIVGWTALGLLSTGLYLWWPKRGRMFAQLRMYQGPPVRRWLTWHRSSGVLLLPLLLLSTLTGIGMVYHDGARGLLTALLGGTATPKPPQHREAGSAANWPRALKIALASVGPGQLTRVAPLTQGNSVVAFRARASGEWHPVGRSLLFVSSSGTRVVLKHDATRQQLGARIDEALYPLHIGSVGGTAVKWGIALGGLAPSILVVTGFLFWRRRRR